MSKPTEVSKAQQEKDSVPSVENVDFGKAFASPPQPSSGSFASSGNRSAGSLPTEQRGNFGVQRNVKRTRVLGQKPASLSSASRSGTSTYGVADSIQFNETDEMVLNTLSLQACYDILTELFVERWGLDTSNTRDMRKAEDVICALFAVRTASPYADYDFAVMIGGKEVQVTEFDNVLALYEKTRRQFSRGWADKTVAFVRDESNVRLRQYLKTTLGIYDSYVHLAFDGSTGCSMLNRNEVAFVKSLESQKLFDDPSVRGSLQATNLLDGQFDHASTKRRNVVV